MRLWPAAPPGTTVPSTGAGDPYINVRSAPYSAKGDGVTDDTAAIQAAINAAATAGLAVFFPYTATGYLITGAGLTISTTGMRLFGSSVIGTQLSYNGTGFCITVTNAVGGGVAYVDIEDTIQINCTNALGQGVQLGPNAYKCKMWALVQGQQAGGVSRQVTDLATTALSSVVTSATANFTSADVGASIGAATVIPPGSFIITVTNSTTVTISQQVASTNSGLTANIVQVGPAGVVITSQTGQGSYWHDFDRAHIRKWERCLRLVTLSGQNNANANRLGQLQCDNFGAAVTIGGLTTYAGCGLDMAQANENILTGGQFDTHPNVPAVRVGPNNMYNVLIFRSEGGGTSTYAYVIESGSSQNVLICANNNAVGACPDQSGQTNLKIFGGALNNAQVNALTGTVPLVVNTPTSAGSPDIAEFNVNGVTKAKVNYNGDFFCRLIQQFASTGAYLDTSNPATPGNGAIVVNTRTNSNGGLAIVGQAGQTSAPFQIYKGSTQVHYIDQNGHVNMGDATNIVAGTTTGTKIGTASNQKLGFFNAAPVVQPSGTPAAATDLASVISLANSLRTALLALGLVA